MALLIQDEVDFRAKKINRDKVGFYIMIKELIHKGDKKNLMWSHLTSEKKLTELEGEIDKPIIKTGNINTPFSGFERTNRQKNQQK